MGGSKTKTVGGQATSPVAKDFSNYLQSSMEQNGAFQNTMNSLLNSPQSTSMQQYMQGLQGNQLGNNAIDLSFLQGGTQRPQLQQTDLSSILGGQFNAPQNSTDFSSLLNQQFTAPQGQTQVTPFQAQQRTPTDFNSANAEALQQIANTNMQDQANALRERFTATGGGTARGTPAAFAEAVLRSRAPAELAAQLGQFSQAESGLDLQNQALNQQGALQTLGLGLQQDATNIAAQLQAMGMDTQQAQALASTMLQQGGMNMSAQLQAMGYDANQAQALASMMLQQNQATANTQLQGQQLDQNQLGMLLQGLQGNAANALNAQTQNQNFGLNLGQLMQSQQGIDQNAQLQVLSQLFNSLNQARGQGTSQAQTIQTPGTFQNIMGGLTGILGGAANIATGGGLRGLFGNFMGNKDTTQIPGTIVPWNGATNA